MCPSKKTHSTRKHRQTQRWIVPASALLLLAIILSAAYFWYPKNSANSHQDQLSAFETFADHYIWIMQNLNSTETKANIAALLDPKYNQTDLLTWEQTKLTFTQDTKGFFEDPTQILNNGKGICVQWSIVYVSACLALNHPSRLVVAADTTSWSFIHTWAEDYYNESWVHVDPSDKVWNSPLRYQGWDWGPAIGSGVRIYAFNDRGFEDITSSYIPRSN